MEPYECGCCALQEEEYGDIGAYFGTKPDVPHMWGFQYLLSEWRMGEEFFWACKKASRLAQDADPCATPRVLSLALDMP